MTNIEPICANCRSEAMGDIAKKCKEGLED
jgi:hypothetical protein